MFEKLNILSIANGLSTHASARHSAVAQNVANADTPNYKAKDIAPFSDVFSAKGTSQDMKATRRGHFSNSETTTRLVATKSPDDQTSPNGNNVSLENEMVKAAEVKHQFDLALSVYSKSLDILRTSIGR